MVHRLPIEKASITGADIKNPKRHKGRSAPAARPLGVPSDWLDDDAAKAWEAFKAEIPYLMERDRAMLEICSMVRGDLMAGKDVGVTRVSMYQSILSKLAASPVDASKVSVPDDGDEDPADQFFKRPN